MNTKQKSGNIQPLHDRVLIREIKKNEKKTESGIIIPESVKDDHSTRRGHVVAIGKGKMEDGVLVPMAVKVGDEVLFGWGEEVSIDGENYSIVKDADILAIIK